MKATPDSWDGLLILAIPARGRYTHSQPPARLPDLQYQLPSLQTAKTLLSRTWLNETRAEVFGDGGMNQAKGMQPWDRPVGGVIGQ